MEKKIIAIALVLVVMVTAFVGCGQKYKTTKVGNNEYLLHTDAEGNTIIKDDQLVELASFRLNSLLYSVLSDVDLCSIKTYGDFTDRGYMMQCDFVYTCSVARRVPINMEEK